MFRSGPLRSTLNTSYITVWACVKSICTEAVHCVALSTRVASQVWACVASMYRSGPLRSTLNTSYITGLGMCRVCSETLRNFFFNHISFRKKLFFFKPLLLSKKSSFLITFLFERNSFFNHIPFRKKLFFFNPLFLLRKSSFLITFLFEKTLLF